jgi:hypothetical protein
MKIVKVVTLHKCGSYAASIHWRKTRKQILSAVKRCEWPIGSGSFTIYPQSGKKRNEGNGVGPIRKEFVEFLKKSGWAIEGPAKNALDQRLGDFDAVLTGPEKPIVVEWETGNISSSHRSMNKLTMLLSCAIISAGVLVVPRGNCMCISPIESATSGSLSHISDSGSPCRASLGYWS